jgi:hypothetical protein
MEKIVYNDEMVLLTKKDRLNLLHKSLTPVNFCMAPHKMPEWQMLEHEKSKFRKESNIIFSELEHLIIVSIKIE